MEHKGTIEINVSLLEKVITSFFDKIKLKKYDSFQFEKDFYWSVPEDGLYDVLETPELHIGSLRDDIAFLTSLVKEGYDANFLELERLSAIFKSLSCLLEGEESGNVSQ